MLCKECNCSGDCAWCGGTGRGRFGSACDRCRGSGICFSCSGQKLDGRMINSMLEDLAEAFKSKIDDAYQLVAQFIITDLKQGWAVVIQPGKNIAIHQGQHKQARFIFKTAASTLLQIYSGELTAMTATGRSGSAEVPPLQVSLAKGLDANAERNRIFSFLQQFFNRTQPEKVVLAEKHSRRIHGGHAIPLYSSNVQRSAWYMLKNGDKLNEPGKPNPFPQSFIFIEGEGFATIGSDTVKVKAGESYYVPPKSDHVVWNENKEPLVLISLAWNEGA